MKKKVTILYVDDEPINLQLFEINFRNNYDVISSESGLKGIELLKTIPNIPLVISDMKMPQMNGIEFIKIAKQEFPSILFYILTGFEITEEIADALNEQLILRYFRKPFNMKELIASIEEALS